LKFKLRDIFAVWDGETSKHYYYACLCKSDKGQYNRKDLQRVGVAKLMIERNETPWWQVKEEGGAYNLYYYPSVIIEEKRARNKKTAQEKGIAESVIFNEPYIERHTLESVTKMFNGFLKFELSVADNPP